MSPRTTATPLSDQVSSAREDRTAVVVFAVATAREYTAAFGALGAPAAPAPGQAVVWRRGGRDQLLVVTGVGPVAAALTMGRVLQEAAGAVRGVVALGVTGGFDLDDTPLCSLIGATQEALPEYGLRTGAGTDSAAIGFPQLCANGQDVFDRLSLDPGAAAEVMGLRLPSQVRLGPCVTVAGVSGDDARAAILARKYQAVAESMEGFAVALAAQAAGLPCLELRCVSNRVGCRPPDNWDLPGALAGLGQAVANLFSE